MARPTFQPYDEEQLAGWVAGRPEVDHHQTMLMLGVDGANLLFAGDPQTTSIQQNSLVVPNGERDLLLDLDNLPITEVAPGTVVLPVYYEVQAGLEVGDPVTITAPDGFAKELTISGFARDSIMNPAITSSKRLAVAASGSPPLAAQGTRLLRQPTPSATQVAFTYGGGRLRLYVDGELAGSAWADGPEVNEGDLRFGLIDGVELFNRALELLVDEIDPRP